MGQVEVSADIVAKIRGQTEAPENSPVPIHFAGVSWCQKERLISSTFLFVKEFKKSMSKTFVTS